MPRGPKNLRITFDAEALTHYGGAVLIHHFLQRLGLRTALWRLVRFRQRNNRYRISETVLAVLYPVILGMERLGFTESLRHNGVFQYLTGLPGYPDATSLRRFLRRFSRVGRVAFLKLHDRYRRTMLASLRQYPILDLDGTVLTVYGHQQMAEVSYNPRKRGRPSYHAIFCFEGHTRDCLEGTLHPGKTHVLKVIRPIIEQALRRLPKGKPFRVRADKAFYDGLFRAWLEEHRAQYVIGARVTTPVKHRLSGLRYHQVRRGVWTAEFRYCPQGWQHPARFVVIRRPVPEEPSAQLHLFKMEGYTYQVLVTNLRWAPLTVWRFYNNRSRAELIIRELKAAYALNKIPMQDFGGTEVFFQLVLLAYDLLTWFKRLCAPPSLQRATMQRLRRHSFSPLPISPVHRADLCSGSRTPIPSHISSATRFGVFIASDRYN